MTTATCPKGAQRPFTPKMPQNAAPEDVEAERPPHNKDKRGPGGAAPPDTEAQGREEPFIPRDTPANPFARKTAALYQAMVHSVTAEDMQAVAQRLLEMAKNGNLQAIKLLLSYAMGKPQPAPDPDRLDIHEWEIHKASTNMIAEAPAIIRTPEPELPLKCVRMVRQATTRQMSQHLADRLWRPEKFGHIPESERAAAMDAEFDRIMSRRVQAEMHGDLPLPVRRGRRRASTAAPPPSANGSHHPPPASAGYTE